MNDPRANDPRVQAMYTRLMQLAAGPLTDQKISLYATCDPQFAADRLPPLTDHERKTLLSQIKPPFVANQKATDRVLCSLVVHSWAREAVARANVKTHVYDDYWNGDPETTAAAEQPTENFLGRLARRLHLR